MNPGLRGGSTDPTARQRLNRVQSHCWSWITRFPLNTIWVNIRWEMYFALPVSAAFSRISNGEPFSHKDAHTKDNVETGAAADRTAQARRFISCAGWLFEQTPFLPKKSVLIWRSHDVRGRNQMMEIMSSVFQSPPPWSFIHLSGGQRSAFLSRLIPHSFFLSLPFHFIRSSIFGRGLHVWL